MADWIKFSDGPRAGEAEEVLEWPPPAQVPAEGGRYIRTWIREDAQGNESRGATYRWVPAGQSAGE